jgi:predicted nucleic acid-binding protein
VRTVVDASVAAKWYFAEVGHASADRVLAERMRGERELFAPDLLVAEFANVLWKRVRRGECTRDAARQILGFFDVDRPELVPSAHLLHRAFDLATELAQPVYDCLYLALAQGIEASLATSDRRLARAARSLALPVELI